MTLNKSQLIKLLMDQLSEKAVIELEFEVTNPEECFPTAMLNGAQMRYLRLQKLVTTTLINLKITDRG